LLPTLPGNRTKRHAGTGRWPQGLLPCAGQSSIVDAVQTEFDVGQPGEAL